MQPISYDMTFSQALEMLKKGNKVTRSGWNGKNQFVFLTPGSEFTVNNAPLTSVYPEGTTIRFHAHLDIKTAEGFVAMWIPSITDLLATDWVLLA